MNKKRYFYVNTIYSLLVSLIYFDDNKENIYFIESTIPKKIRNNLKNIIYIEDYKKKYKLRIYRYLKIYFRSKKILNLVKKVDEIYIQDHFEYGQFFLNNIKGKIFLIEDGTKNYNEKILDEEYNKKYKINSIIKNKILYLSKNIYPIYGLSNRIEKIYLTGILPVPKKIRSKVQLINLEKKWQELSCIKKKEILDIFNIDIFKIENIEKIKDKILLITQPLSEDGIISEQEKLEIYREILENNKKEKIYIKAHPRETTNYKEKFQNYNIELVEKEFPIELFMLLDMKFKKIITLFSTAALNFKCKYQIEFIGTKNYSKLYEKFGDIKI